MSRKEWIVAPDVLAAIADLERRYDGPIPADCGWSRDSARPISSSGYSPKGRAALYTSMVLGRLRIIRSRRAEGSYYPGLVDDLRTYRQGWRRWHRRRGRLRAASSRG
jgi:hypothetical protein